MPFDLIHPEGLDYLDHQVESIQFGRNFVPPSAAKRLGLDDLASYQGPRCFFNCDEPGLGKTIQALGLINSYGKDCRFVLIIGPKSLMPLVWQPEAEMWLVEDFEHILVGKKKLEPIQLDRERPLLVLVSYEGVLKNFDVLEGVPWDVVIIDEEHNLANHESKRSKSVFAPALRPAKLGVLLTATPLVNSVLDLWAGLQWCDPDYFPQEKFDRFKKRFAVIIKVLRKNKNGEVTRGANGAPISDEIVKGGQELELLNRIFRQYTIRRRKSKILKNLPPKISRPIFLEQDATVREMLARQRDAIADRREAIRLARYQVEAAKRDEKAETVADRLKAVRKMTGLLIQEISKTRHDQAMAKVPAAADYIRHALTENEKIVVFAHHTDVIEAMHKEFADCSVMFHGQMSLDARVASVKSFKRDAACRLIIASIRSAGVGLTLIEAWRGIFVELDWTKAKMTQAEDRIHRIGQLNQVLIEYLLIDGSMDGNLIEKIIEKEALHDQVVEDQEEEDENLLQESWDAARDEEKKEPQQGEQPEQEDDATALVRADLTARPPATARFSHEQIGKAAARLPRESIQRTRATFIPFVGEMARITKDAERPVQAKPNWIDRMLARDLYKCQGAWTKRDAVIAQLIMYANKRLLTEEDAPLQPKRRSEHESGAVKQRTKQRKGSRSETDTLPAEAGKVREVQHELI